MFLGSDAGMKYLFQGNAATYNDVPDELQQKVDGYTKETSAMNKRNQKRAEKRKELGLKEGDVIPAELEDETYPADKLAAWRQASDELTAHFNQQDYSVEGAYRAYMGADKEDDEVPGRIPKKYWPEHKHMMNAYAQSWDEYVRVIPKEERGNMAAAYVARLEADADPKLKEAGVLYDPKTNKIDPDYQQRLADAFAKWEGMISNFCHMPDPKTGAIDLGKFEDPDFAIIFARTEARYMLDGLYLSDDGTRVEGGSDFLTREDNLKKLAAHGVVFNIDHGRYDEVCPVRDAIEFKRKYEAAGGPEVHLHIPDETGHSPTERGNALGLKNIMDTKVPKITMAEMMGGPQGPLDHVADVDTDKTGPYFGA